MGKELTDISGQRFGRLTAISPTRSNGVTFWNCKCDCGNTVVVRLNNLRQGLTQSCGCLRIKTPSKAKEEAKKKAAEERARRLDVTGKRFGYLTVIEQAETPDGMKDTFWRCRCDCGKETVVDRRRLVNGNVRSCGCRRKTPLKLTGQRFGKLIVVGKNVPASKIRGKSVWNCVCDCGTEVLVAGNVLVDGNKKSCGCMQKGRPPKAEVAFMRDHGCADCADKKTCGKTKCKYENELEAANESYR